MIFIGNSEDSPSLVREKIKMTVDRLIKALDDH
jgi:hypothetical protein